jgi:hypothetical protein
VQRCREHRFGFGETLAAAGPDAEVAPQIADVRRTGFDSAMDLPVRNGFADAYDHGGILNANANDCQLLIMASRPDAFAHRCSIRYITVSDS